MGEALLLCFFVCKELVVTLKTIYVVYKDYEVLFRGLITLHFLNGVMCCIMFH